MSDYAYACTANRSKVAWLKLISLRIYSEVLSLLVLFERTERSIAILLSEPQTPEGCSLQ